MLCFSFWQTYTCTFDKSGEQKKANVFVKQIWPIYIKYLIIQQKIVQLMLTSKMWIVPEV